MSYNMPPMAKELSPTRYSLSFEQGQLIRRGTKKIRGREVTLYTNYTMMPEHIRAQAAANAIGEAAMATGSNPETVYKQLLQNYFEAARKREANSNHFVFDYVPVTPITYTVDPRRRPIRIMSAPIVTSLS